MFRIPNASATIIFKRYGISNNNKSRVTNNLTTINCVKLLWHTFFFTEKFTYSLTNSPPIGIPKKKKNLGRYWARPPSKILPIQSCENCPISLHKLLMWHPILPLWMNNKLTPMLLKTNTQSQSIKSNSGDKDHGKKRKKKEKCDTRILYIYIYA